MTDNWDDAMAKAAEVEKKAKKLARKIRIVSDPDILGGEWCIEGHRIPAKMVKRYLDQGYSIDIILADYPTLTREEVIAARDWIEPKPRSAKKQTSSRVSTLAAKYLRMTDDDLWALATAKPIEDRKPFFADIRSMAASLLSQDETK